MSRRISLRSPSMSTIAQQLILASWVLYRSSLHSYMIIQSTSGTSESRPIPRPRSQRLTNTPYLVPTAAIRRSALARIAHARRVNHRLRPFENEPVSGDMRVQITFEANKVSTVIRRMIDSTHLAGFLASAPRHPASPHFLATRPRDPCHRRTHACRRSAL